MLPDYTKAKSEIRKLIERNFKRRVDAYLGPYAFKEYRIFEGRNYSTKTDDGKTLTGNLKEFSGTYTIRAEDIKSGDPTNIFQELDTLAKDMAEQQIKMFLGELGRVCHDTGQEFDFEGRKFSTEMFFAAMEGIQIDFDEKGNMNKLMLILGPSLYQRAQEILQEIDTNHDLKKQYNDLVEKKRLDWRDREASRKLVG
jgi:hypothetical protein